jgi:3'-phosphoadenosine 5'-phosphosulfate (PAPS) 3'-phosphatase
MYSYILYLIYKVADFGAQAIVNWILKNNFPEDSIVGEEESSFLRSEEGQSLSDRIFQLVNEVADKPVTRDQVRYYNTKAIKVLKYINNSLIFRF